MKAVAALLSAALAAVAFLSGCNRSSAQSPRAAAAAPAPAATFKAGRGLQLSPRAATFIDLQTAAVAPRDFAGASGLAAIPAEALLRTAKGDFVFVVNGGWFLRTPVLLGATDGAWFAVKDGLYEGDTVVSRGVRALWLAEIQAVNGGVGCADGH